MGPKASCTPLMGTWCDREALLNGGYTPALNLCGGGGGGGGGGERIGREGTCMYQVCIRYVWLTHIHTYIHSHTQQAYYTRTRILTYTHTHTYTHNVSYQETSPSQHPPFCEIEAAIGPAGAQLIPVMGPLW